MQSLEHEDFEQADSISDTQTNRKLVTSTATHHTMGFVVKADVVLQALRQTKFKAQLCSPQHANEYAWRGVQACRPGLQSPEPRGAPVAVTLRFFNWDGKVLVGVENSKT